MGDAHVQVSGRGACARLSQDVGIMARIRGERQRFFGPKQARESLFFGCFLEKSYLFSFGVAILLTRD